MKTQKIAVVGSRAFVNPGVRALIEWELKCLLLKATKNGISLEIVSGGARGVDSIAAQWARDNEVSLIEILPDWDTHGRAAGFIRNEVIWDKADCGIAFWDGKSKGTAHSFDLAKEQSKPIKIVTIQTEVRNP